MFSWERDKVRQACVAISRPTSGLLCCFPLAKNNPFFLFFFLSCSCEKEKTKSTGTLRISGVSSQVQDTQKQNSSYIYVRTRVFFSSRNQLYESIASTLKRLNRLVYSSKTTNDLFQYVCRSYVKFIHNRGTCMMYFYSIVQVGYCSSQQHGSLQTVLSLHLVFLLLRHVRLNCK